MEAEARIRAARSGYLPRVQFQRQFAQENFALASLNRPDALSNCQSRLTVEQVLFDSRQTSRGVEAARFTREIAGEDTRRSHSDIILSVLRTYFGVQLTEKNLEVSKKPPV